MIGYNVLFKLVLGLFGERNEIYYSFFQWLLSVENVIPVFGENQAV